MTANEKEIEELENIFPTLSGIAFSAAFKTARELGQSILVSELDTIYDILPDGTRKVVKKIEGPHTYNIGEEIILR